MCDLTVETELQEFISFQNEESNETIYKWSHADTLILLNLYKLYRKKVGTLELKTTKKMFEIISKEIGNKYGKIVTPERCENRWKVLERGYKSYVNNNNSTGRGRKVFEYAEIMADILGKKKNVHPIIVLNSTTVDEPEAEKVPESNIDSPSPSSPHHLHFPLDTDIGASSMNNRNTEYMTMTTTVIRDKENIHKKKRKLYHTRKRKLDILEEIRQDRQQYYNKRLEMENKKLEEKIKKNILLEEQNKILKENQSSNHK